MKKPRGDSKLKTLPPERQREMYGYLQAHTLAETEAWLATAGLDVSLDTLSRFASWYPLAAPLQQAAHMGEAVKELLKELPGLNLNEEQLSKAGQAIFEAEALRTKDSELHVSLRTLRLQEESGRTKARQKERALDQKDRDFQLQREKFVGLSCEKILKAAKDPAMREIAEAEISNAEKIARIRKAYFADIDALEVELPE